jgi:hypothetical protein
MHTATASQKTKNLLLKLQCFKQQRAWDRQDNRASLISDTEMVKLIEQLKYAGVTFDC